MIESLIIGAILNIWSIKNVDFFYHKAKAEKNMECKWERIEARPPQAPAITLFNRVIYKQVCFNKAPIEPMPNPLIVRNEVE